MVRNDASFSPYYPSNIKNGSTRDRGMTEPLFSSSFPAPPRRQAPTLHDVPFGENENSATFRHADSTSRALQALAQAKYERMERRRAMFLLVLLVLMAITVHGVAGGYFSMIGTALPSNVEQFKGRISERGSGNMIPDETRSKGSRGGGSRGGAMRGGKPDGIAGPGVADESQIQMERVMGMFSNLAETSTPSTDAETPLFWHVPRAGGSTMKDIMGQCLGLVSASEVGVRDGHGQDAEVQIIEFKGLKYVNADTTSTQGLDRAKAMGLVQSGLSDVIVSSYLVGASNLFTPEFNGRVFAILRDPVERAVSMYYYRSGAYGDLQGVSLEQYAQGNGIENNWMTRYLVNQMEGELGKEQLDYAKEVLRRKFLIGFLDDLDESVYRFMKFFNWQYSENDTEALNQEECIKTLTEVGVNRNQVKYEIPQRGSQAYALITWQTQYDIKLYEYGKELFDQQTKIWGSKERKKKDKQKKKGNN